MTNLHRIIRFVSYWSLFTATKNYKLLARLRQIVPDISQQEFTESLTFDATTELKRRAQQAFQCEMMLKALSLLKKTALSVVDIGDSAGTHLHYLKHLAQGRVAKTLSVNLDPRAIDKLKAKGFPALLSRAEDLDFKGVPVDLFMSFEMVEHLHDPATFLYRLAQSNNGRLLLLTVPYLRESRTGFYHIRHNSTAPVYAEDVHIFELSPEDWTLLFRHAGWKIVYQETYYQYPRWMPFLRYFWKRTDFEGFWGAILERDDTYSSLYQDWPNPSAPHLKCA